MTVRNIRAHQSRALLPPPQVRGRTGYYGARARAADRADPRAAGRRLQARGDLAPARERRRLDRGGAEVHPRGQGAVRGRAAADRQRRRAGRALASGRDGAAAAPQGRAARDPAAPARRQLRGAEPDARPGERRARRARDPRRGGARGGRRDPQARRCGREGVRGAVRATRSGSRSRTRVAPSTTCPRSARRSSACARSPPTRCWRCSSS